MRPAMGHCTDSLFHGIQRAHQRVRTCAWLGRRPRGSLTFVVEPSAGCVRGGTFSEESNGVVSILFTIAVWRSDPNSSSARSINRCLQTPPQPGPAHDQNSVVKHGGQVRRQAQQHSEVRRKLALPKRGNIELQQRVQMNIVQEGRRR